MIWTMKVNDMSLYFLISLFHFSFLFLIQSSFSSFSEWVSRSSLVFIVWKSLVVVSFLLVSV